MVNSSGKVNSAWILMIFWVVANCKYFSTDGTTFGISATSLIETKSFLKVKTAKKSHYCPPWEFLAIVISIYFHCFITFTKSRSWNLDSRRHTILSTFTVSFFTSISNTFVSKFNSAELFAKISLLFGIIHAGLSCENWMCFILFPLSVWQGNCCLCKANL